MRCHPPRGRDKIRRTHLLRFHSSTPLKYCRGKACATPGCKHVFAPANPCDGVGIETRQDRGDCRRPVGRRRQRENCRRFVGELLRGSPLRRRPQCRPHRHHQRQEVRPATGSLRSVAGRLPQRDRQRRGSRSHGVSEGSGSAAGGGCEGRRKSFCLEPRSGDSALSSHDRVGGGKCSRTREDWNDLARDRSGLRRQDGPPRPARCRSCSICIS